MKKIIYALLFSTALVSCGDGDAYKMIVADEPEVSGDHYWYFEVASSKIPLRLIPSEDGGQLTPEVDVTIKVAEKVDLPSDAILECPKMEVSMYYESIDQGSFEDFIITEESSKALAELLKSGKKGKLKLTFAVAEPIEAVKAEAIATQACDFNIYGASFDTSKASSSELFDALFPDNSSWSDVFNELEDKIEEVVELYDDAESDSEIRHYAKEYAKVELMLAKLSAAGGEEHIDGHSSTIEAVQEFNKLW